MGLTEQREVGPRRSPVRGRRAASRPWLPRPAPGRAASPAPRAARQPPQPAGSLPGERTAGPGVLASPALCGSGPQAAAASRGPARRGRSPSRSATGPPGFGGRGSRSLSVSAAVAVAGTWHRLPRPGLSSRLKGAPQDIYPPVRSPRRGPPSRPLGKGKGVGWW